ncbi:MAG: hypothetical protein GXY06_06290 [Clostridiaceae bacterium]|nr:hypothetical protein [Clostridiaceae bacterium]
MDSIQVKCPGCGQVVLIEQGKKRESCNKCSTWVDVRDAVKVSDLEVSTTVMDTPAIAVPLVSTGASLVEDKTLAMQKASPAPIVPEAPGVSSVPIDEVETHSNPPQQAIRLELKEAPDFPVAENIDVELKENVNFSAEDKTETLVSDCERLFNEGTALLEQGRYPLAEKIFIAMSLQYPDDYRGWWGRLRASSKDFKAREKKEITKEYMMKASSLVPDEALKFQMRKKYNDWLRDLAVARVKRQSRIPESSYKKIDDAAEPMDYTVKPVRTSGNWSKSCVIVPIAFVLLFLMFIISLMQGSPAPIITLLIIVGAIVAFANKDGSN